jgi:hypothetical protein
MINHGFYDAMIAKLYVCVTKFIILVKLLTWSGGEFAVLPTPLLVNSVTVMLD